MIRKVIAGCKKNVKQLLSNFGRVEQETAVISQEEVVWYTLKQLSSILQPC